MKLLVVLTLAVVVVVVIGQNLKGQKDNNRRFGGLHGFEGRGHGSSSEEHNPVAKTKTTRKPTTTTDPCIGVASGTIVGPCNGDGTCLGTSTCLPTPYDYTQQDCICP